MENELQTTQANNALAALFPDNTGIFDLAKSVQKGGAFLGNLKLVQGNSKYKEEPINAKEAEFIALMGKNDMKPEHLGMEVDLIFIDVKIMAVNTSGEGRAEIVGPDSEKFAEFRQLADDKVNGYFWGYNFLVYCGDTGKFYAFLCANPSQHRFARYTIITDGADTSLMKKFLTVGTEAVKDHVVNGKKTNFRSMTAKENTAGFKNMPTVEELGNAMEAFRRDQSSPTGEAGEDVIENATSEGAPVR